MRSLVKNGQGYFTIFWILLLATIAIIFVIDVALDDPDQIGTVHFVVESAIIFISLGSATALGLSWLQAQRRVADPSGGSTAITSAPRSARICPHKIPRSWARSTTR